MLLNRFEYRLMNNPLRAAIQRYLEARRLLKMGGAMNGGVAIEIGCGRGVGIELILDLFGADTVAGFDFDPRMVALAQARLAKRGKRTRLWVGDATQIASPNAVYDAVFDFGIIHHVPRWRDAVAEVARVLKPGGRFYGEEVLKSLVVHPVVRRLFKHPTEDRFDAASFRSALEDAGLALHRWKETCNWAAWFVAIRGCNDNIQACLIVGKKASACIVYGVTDFKPLIETSQTEHATYKWCRCYQDDVTTTHPRPSDAFHQPTQAGGIDQIGFLEVNRQACLRFRI